MESQTVCWRDCIMMLMDVFLSLHLCHWKQNLHAKLLWQTCSFNQQSIQKHIIGHKPVIVHSGMSSCGIITSSQAEQVTILQTTPSQNVQIFLNNAVGWSINKCMDLTPALWDWWMTSCSIIPSQKTELVMIPARSHHERSRPAICQGMWHEMKTWDHKVLLYVYEFLAVLRFVK